MERNTRNPLSRTRTPRPKSRGRLLAVAGPKLVPSPAIKENTCEGGRGRAGKEERVKERGWVKDPETWTSIPGTYEDYEEDRKKS